MTYITRQSLDLLRSTICPIGRLAICVRTIRLGSYWRSRCVGVLFDCTFGVLIGCVLGVPPACSVETSTNPSLGGRRPHLFPLGPGSTSCPCCRMGSRGHRSEKVITVANYKCQETRSECARFDQRMNFPYQGCLWG